MVVWDEFGWVWVPGLPQGIVVVFRWEVGLRCWKNKVCPRVPELVRIGWSGLVAVNTGLFHNLYIH